MSNVLPLHLAGYANTRTWSEAYKEALELCHFEEDSLERECGLSSFEKGFNLAGYAPAISNISAVIRAWFGVIIAVEGVVRLTFNSLVFCYYSSRENYQSYRSEKISSMVNFSEKITTSKRKTLNGMRFFCHGVVNIIRAVVEFIPIFGNLSCWVYDNSGLRLRYNVTDVTRTLKGAKKSGRELAFSKSQYALTPALYMPRNSKQKLIFPVELKQ